MLGAFEADPAGDIIAANRREPGEGDEGAGDGAEDAVHNFVGWGLGQSEREIAAGDTAQAGDGKVKQSDVKAAEHMGHRKRGEFERFNDEEREQVLGAVAEGGALAHHPHCNRWVANGRGRQARQLVVTVRTAVSST